MYLSASSTLKPGRAKSLRWVASGIMFLLVVSFVHSVPSGAKGGRNETPNSTSWEQSSITGVGAIPREPNGSRTNPKRPSTRSLANGSFLAPLQPAPGAISFTSPEFTVSDTDATASITLTRTGGSDGTVEAKVTPKDITTTPADYQFSPGSLDPTFQADSQSGFEDKILLEPDGKIIVAGPGGAVRLNSNGRVDTTFSFAFNTVVQAVAEQPDGKLLIGGGFSSIDHVGRNNIARLNSDGTLDTTFDPGEGPDQDVQAIAVQPDGKILIGGDFNLVDGGRHQFLARLNSDGSLDESFLSPGDVAGDIYQIIIQPDGKILAAGFGISRSNPDGSVDTEFHNYDTPVQSIALQSDGRIIIGGAFTSYGGTPTNRLARINADGSLDPTFNIGSGPDNVVEAVAVQPDGKVFVGGYFDSFNSALVANLVRLNNDGSLDQTFSAAPEINQPAEQIVVQPDGKVLVSGGASGSSLPLKRLNGDLFTTWVAGDSATKVITLPIRNSLIAGPTRELGLELSTYGGATGGTYTSATLNITNSNQPPAFTSAPPSATILTNTPFNFELNASGNPSPSFTITGGSLPPGISLLANGVLSGTPMVPGTYANITVTASNGVAPSASQTFTIKVENPPVAVDQFYGTIENSALIVPAPGVLTNASDQSGGTLVAVLVRGPGNGKLALNSDGSFTYTPAASFTGNDSFTYQGNDGTFKSNTAAVYITVNSGGTLQFSSATYTVNDTDSAATITVSRTGGSAGTATVGYATSDGTAVAGTDYTAASGTLTFGPGETVETFTIPISNQSVSTGNKTILLTLSDPAGSATLDNVATALLTIIVAPPTFQFSAAAYTASEGDGSAVITVTRKGDTSKAVSVDYATSDGTASDRTRYIAAIGTLNFDVGESSKTFPILLIDNGYVDGDQTVNLALSNPSNGGLLGPQNTAVLTIADNDTSPATVNPIDDPHYFVQQQYFDFLNRLPDSGGLAYWTGQLNSLMQQCESETNPSSISACILGARAQVSTAFFLSPEFQQTGYFVIRLYVETLGRVPTMREFLAGTQAVGNGVVALAPGWQQLLEANEAAFANSMVNRSDFQGLYGNLSNAEYINQLFANGGASVTDEETLRTALVTGLTYGTETRATVLGKVADSKTVFNAQYNPAFVLTQYFGYLRRNPSDPPDSDLSGYVFWLDKMNEFTQTGDNAQDPTVALSRVQRAQMVEAFIDSKEYRSRFGPN